MEIKWDNNQILPLQQKQFVLGIITVWIYVLFALQQNYFFCRGLNEEFYRGSKDLLFKQGVDWPWKTGKNPGIYPTRE